MFFSERAFLRGGDSATPVQSLIDAISVQWSGGPSTVTIPVGASESDVEGLLFPVVNDAIHLLGEHPASAPDDIDVAYTQGHSFPRYLGGPLWWADNLGLARIKAGLEAAGCNVSPHLASATDLTDLQAKL